MAVESSGAGVALFLVDIRVFWAFGAFTGAGFGCLMTLGPACSPSIFRFCLVPSDGGFVGALLALMLSKCKSLGREVR